MSSSNKAPQGEALASAPAAPGKDLFDGLFGDLPAEAAAVKKEDTRPKEEAEAEGTKKRKGAEEDGDGNGEGGQKRPKEEGAAAAVSKEGKGSVDLEAALQKISGALRSSKVDKFRKAGELLLKLMQDMDMFNRSHFHSALAFFMAEEGSWERLVGSVEDRALSEKIFGEVQKRILVFTPEEQYRAATWVLLGSIRPRLYTDDTFEFRRAMRELKEYVTCLQPYDSVNDSFADKERRRAVLVSLETALKRGLLFQWAKGSAEEALALATEKRLVVFPEEERERLDEMATQLRANRHGQSVNPTGSVVSRSVRLANSMSTPWNRKSGDVFR